jgi:hypothetical protein
MGAPRLKSGRTLVTTYDNAVTCQRTSKPPQSRWLTCELLAVQELYPVPIGGAELAARVRKESENYGRITREANTKLEWKLARQILVDTPARLYASRRKDRLGGDELSAGMAAAAPAADTR